MKSHHSSAWVGRVRFAHAWMLYRTQAVFIIKGHPQRWRLCMPVPSEFKLDGQTYTNLIGTLWIGQSIEDKELRLLAMENWEAITVLEESLV